MQLSIPIGVILGSIYLKEKVSGLRWVFIGMVFFGLTLICFDPVVFQSRLSLILGIYVLILLYIYTCIINVIVGFKVTYDTIAKNKSERSYNSLFETKEDIDFNL